jgi:hypothetical protein
MDFSHILTEPYILTLTILMAASLIILCIYYAIFHFRVGRYKGPKKKNTAPATSSPCPPVSVVLTAQNDAKLPFFGGYADGRH